MVQDSILNYYLPIATRCLHYISPKYGTILTSLGGICLSVFYMSCLDADKILIKAGVAPWATLIITHVFAIFGVHMLPVNILLLIASFTYNEYYVLMWLWFTIVFLVFASCLVLVIFIYCMFGNVLFGLSLLGTHCGLWFLVYLLIFPIVNGFRRSIHTVVIFLG